MIDDDKLLFPDLMLFDDYNGNFDKFFKEVYKIFQTDFINNNPTFNNHKVSAQKHPEVDGMHRTFYHITHEGENEDERIPDIRRMERIRFPKFLIENSNHQDILIWENTRGRDKRILLFNLDEGYIVVLTERKDYYLFWTAYLVEQNHRKEKLKREYEAFIKAKTA